MAKKKARKKKAARKKARGKKTPKKKAGRKKTGKKRIVKKKVARKKVARKKAAKKKAPAKRRAAAKPKRFVPEGSDSLLLVMSGPSGAGKSTLARRLAMAESRIWRSASMTTRAPREGERFGVDYLFCSREDFERSIAGDDLIEYATVHGELYGTPKRMVVERLVQGRDVLLEIDVQGAMKVRAVAADAVLIFVVPPSGEAMERRLRDRRSEPEEKIERRLARADEELRMSPHYDYLVVNDDIERALADVLAIVSAERNRMQRRHGSTWWTRRV